jgi:tellurite methyltransferase
MERDEKTLWDAKYAEGSHASMEPDPLLPRAYQEWIADSGPGTALDLAGGVGRHAIWLAERDWKVRLLDISEVGVSLARKNAAKLSHGAVEAEISDLIHATDLGQKQYDLVMVFFYLQRELFPALISALKPGGLLIYKTYTEDQKQFSGGPSHPMYLLQPNELLRAFQSLRILHYHETSKDKGTAELVARKESI